MSAGLKKAVSDPSLNDLLSLLKSEIFMTLNCHAIGTIQAFDPDTQTAQVTLNYKKTYTGPTPKSEPVAVDYPPLADCPVVVLAGGPASLTMPIAVGDTCLVLFNDRAFDTWYSSGQVKQLPNNRMHSFSDAIALVGLRSGASPLENYDPDRAALNHGTTRVAVGASKVLVENATTTLNTTLQNILADVQNLVTALNVLTTAMSAATPVTVVAAIAVPSATAAATIATITASLTTHATQLGGLLE